MQNGTVDVLPVTIHPGSQTCAHPVDWGRRGKLGAEAA